MQISVVAADTENLQPGGEAGVEYDEAILNKYAELVSGTKNQYDITLEVTGKNKAEEPPTDIVLVLDESNSMTGTRFQVLQESAVEFVETTLNQTENVRIGAVGYADTAGNVLPLTNDETELITFINAQTSMTEGTFTQDGLLAAESLFDSTDGHQHIIILLSDGVPTYSYAATAAADVTDDTVQDYGTGLFSGYKITDFDYSTTIGAGSQFYCTAAQAYTIGGKAVTNHGEATIGQILDFKAASDQNTVYSVGILLSDSTPAAGYYTGNFSWSTTLTNGSTEAFWTETNADGIFSPDETLNFYASYTNPDASGKACAMVFNMPSGLEDFLDTDIANTWCRITIDGVETGVYSYSEMVTRNAAGAVNYTETVPAGATYEIEVQLTTKDFDLEDYIGSVPNMACYFSARFGSSGTTVHPYDGRSGFVGPVFAFGSPFPMKTQAEYVLKNVSSDGIEGSTYFDVSALDDLIDVLSSQIYGAITDSIQNGTITDPMGPDFIQFESAAQDGADFKLAASDDALLDGVTVAFSNDTVTVEGLNLSAGETVYITYRVTLQTDASGFVYGQAYPTNDTTTLMPVEGGQDREFPIPLVVGTKTSTSTGGGGSGGSSTYKLTYHPNTTLGEDDDVTSGISSGTTVTVKRGSIFTAPTGYSFLGWSEEVDGTVVYTAGDTFTMPAKNVNLYAVWTTSASGGGSQPALDKENHFSYIIGYPEEDVRPENNITREEAATVFFRLLTNDSRIEYWSQSSGFNDVASARWSNNAISTMANGGILSGYADGSFQPSGYITRAEFATLAARFETEDGTSTLTFSDIDGHWAQADIEKAARLGYITGYEDGTFRPDAYITRAEVMTLLNRVLERHVDSDDELYTGMVTWSDNMEHTKWYYYDVQEATNSHYYELDTDGDEQWTGIRENPDWKSLEETSANPKLFSYG
ncbi:MAG: S-layer homology domain-containing protein [Oscillospiraceae bacterium]|nr:S-layer homology domain-containing protein [Oscillospiraceae bacterium]